jgi:hypothetical protein
LIGFADLERVIDVNRQPRARRHELRRETVREIVDFENTFLLCYVRGPEGLIVELAERLDAAPV